MDVVEQIGGVPYSTKRLTIAHDAWNNIGSLGASVNDGTNVASFAFIAVPEGKTIEISSNDALTAGQGLPVYESFILKLESSQEISAIKLRAVGSADFDVTCMLEEAQFGQ